MTKASSENLMTSLNHSLRHQDNLRLFNFLPLFCNSKTNLCRNGNKKVVYFLDSNHLSAHSADLVANEMIRFLVGNRLAQHKSAEGNQSIRH